MATKKKTNKAGKALVVGAGIAALSAGAYLLLGPDGKKNQKKAKAFIGKVKKEVKKDTKLVEKYIEKQAYPKLKTVARKVVKQAKKATAKKVVKNKKK